MIVVDTNVWARALLGDDETQSSRALQALAAARSKEGVFVPLVVLAVLSWVLAPRGGSAHGFSAPSRASSIPAV